MKRIQENNTGGAGSRGISQQVQRTKEDVSFAEGEVE